MGRCRWRQIGRNDYVEPNPISEPDRKVIANLTVVLAQGMKTIFDVFDNGSFVGQVRTTFGGQFYRIRPKDEFVFVAFTWNSTDPHHGVALLELLRSKESNSKSGS